VNELVSIPYSKIAGIKHLSLNIEQLSRPQRFPGLESLTVKGTSPAGMRNLINLIQNNGHITALAITHNDHLDDHSFEQIITSVPNLTSLDISFCTKVSANAFRDLKGLRKLTSINLNYCMFSDPHVSVLAQACPQLQKVMLARSKIPGPTNTYIYDDGILNLVMYCRETLNYLDLRNSRITTDSIKFMEHHCHQLHKVENLETCEMISLERRKDPKITRKPLDWKIPEFDSKRSYVVRIPSKAQRQKQHKRQKAKGKKID
jgi:hypothetical protein